MLCLIFACDSHRAHLLPSERRAGVSISPPRNGVALNKLINVAALVGIANFADHGNEMSCLLFPCEKNTRPNWLLPATSGRPPAAGLARVAEFALLSLAPSQQQPASDIGAISSCPGADSAAIYLAITSRLAQLGFATIWGPPSGRAPLSRPFHEL